MSSSVRKISALNFQIQPNRDIIDLLERLTLTVKQLREDGQFKDNEIQLLNQKIEQFEKISKIQENQVQLYEQMLQKQTETFKLLNDKVNNLNQIVVELKETNTKLEKKVATERRIGNIKAILMGIFALGIRAL